MRLFRKSKKSNPFEDVLDLNIPKLFHKAIKINEPNTSPGHLMINDYEVALDKPALKVFDTLKISLGKGSTDINNDTPIILTFYKKNGEIEPANMKLVVNKIAKCCKVKNDDWQSIDKLRIESGAWRGRSFFLDENLISIELDDEIGLSLSITGYQDYL